MSGSIPTGVLGQLYSGDNKNRFSTSVNDALAQYKELAEQAADMDAAELTAARAELRPTKTEDAAGRIKAAYVTHYDYKTMQQSERDVAAMLGEEAPSQKRQSIRNKLHRESAKQERPTSREKEKER